MAEISCKHCSSPDCRGCNIYRLEQMLDAGKFDALMNKNRVIQISADVRPVVRGRWKRVFTAEIEETICSVCAHTGFEHFNFCPNCGADMREVQDDWQKCLS